MAIKRTRKRFFVISPRYTFPDAKSCICSEAQMLYILLKEKRMYRKIADGPDCKDKETADYYKTIGIALIKTKKSDGTFETRDVVNRATYINSRLPEIKFSPLYLIGHDIEKCMEPHNMDEDILYVIDELCQTNELDSKGVLVLIKFISVTKWWKTPEALEIKREVQKLLNNYKQSCEAHEAALIRMVI